MYQCLVQNSKNENVCSAIFVSESAPIYWETIEERSVSYQSRNKQNLKLKSNLAIRKLLAGTYTDEVQQAYPA
jgi:phosphoribosyl-AMP cyclohydrolase